MSASSGTTLISPTASNGVANVNAAASTTSSDRDQKRKHTRVHSAHHAHGHHGGHHAHGHHAHGHHGVHHAHHHGHAGHARRSSRSSRRSSGESDGRRALAAGLTMHALDGKQRRKESAGSSAIMQRTTSDTGSGSSRKASDPAPVVSRTPSNTSVLSSEGKRPEGSRHDSNNSGRGRHRDSVEVEVIAGDAAEGEEDGEWESGEETPATALKDNTYTGPAEREQKAAQAAKDKEAQESGDDKGKKVLAESPSDLREPSHSPRNEPKQSTKGFPGTPTPLQTPSAPSGTTSGANSQPGSRPASRPASRRPSLTQRSQSRISLTRPADSTTSLTSLHQEVVQEEKPKAPEPKPEPKEYPFPKMEAEKQDKGKGREKDATGETVKETKRGDSTASHTSQTSQATVKSTTKDTAKLPTHGESGETPDAKPKTDRMLSGDDVQTSPEELPDAPAQKVKGSTSLPRPLSVTSLRSIQSLRAPPHPLNSPTGRSGFLDSPKSAKRVASLHYPPAAPAVVNCETVEGQGWDEDGAPARPPPPTRPERVGSFSSVRSLKGVLGQPRPPVSRAASSRQTAAQAAAAASRLNTTTDPVAYHHSLGFSQATAETAHLLSRFLPQKKGHRPRWAISAREAMAVHEAIANGEEPEVRVGLTDGQYRDAHESLVNTLRELGKTRKGPRRGNTVSKSYSYQALLGGVGAEELQINSNVPRRRASGQTPFEMSVNRCLAQRP
ncbi:hypothetical protein A1Q1_06962 [Trichosporon asahii var. asahii CBS 2479]|uniref:Uncharacterized protein n=1 Tax=Trichosporon asahii var. asahii (strain ATCC 90039 / CBS 2479 / JCM 2466 / KCTC 7840 / NBRC 103889/ NCYC 2677 / UAMH 7654) TaxID=1186058 RepID=J6F498_TRIAS|nr:hypothetical protein A1Q1_06962 [Trichosporon asahii var. asahii CBS 2479]EJT51824.1 hypothetical protein A1Q1_06962 [Trichosporon asahii var. asahii CBS 2479]